MFDLSKKEASCLHGNFKSRPRLIRNRDSLVISPGDQKPFYVTSKENWLDFLDKGIQGDSKPSTSRKYISNAAFILSSLDFDLLFLLESINEDGSSILSPAILNGLQQSIVISVHSLLEGIGSYCYHCNNLEKASKVKEWQVGLCALMEREVPKNVKKSEFEKLSKARNRVHQDKLESRCLDYFARMDANDLCLPLKAIQKVICRIWLKYPKKPIWSNAEEISAVSVVMQ